MRVLRIVGWVVLALVVLGAGFRFAARFSDGPIGYFPGGPLVGTVVSTPVGDWETLVEDGTPIELETRPDDPYSVTIEARIRDGRLYSWSAWEHQWNTHVLADPRVTVRIEGSLYRRLAVRVADPAQLAAVHRRDPASPGEEGGVVFRFDPVPR